MTEKEIRTFIVEVDTTMHPDAFRQFMQSSLLIKALEIWRIRVEEKVEKK